MLRVHVVGDDRQWVETIVQALRNGLDPADCVTASDSRSPVGSVPPHAIVVVRYSSETKLVLQLMRTLFPRIDIVVCEVPDCTEMIIAHLVAGATGYTRKGDNLARLPAILRALHEDAIVFDPDTAAQILRLIQSHRPGDFEKVM